MANANRDVCLAVFVNNELRSCDLPRSLVPRFGEYHESGIIADIEPVSRTCGLLSRREALPGPQQPARQFRPYHSERIRSAEILSIGMNNRFPLVCGIIQTLDRVWASQVS